MDNFVVISGCSGGGKSTLLSELEQQGYTVVEEPGRRVVQAETQVGGSALPWVDMAAFLRRAMAVAQEDYEKAGAGGGQWVFFDRGWVDAVSAFEALSGAPHAMQAGLLPRYHRRVFLTPPWPEIYRQDSERRHDLDAALIEYERLKLAYPLHGYEPVVLPKISVPERAAFVLRTLAQA